MKVLIFIGLILTAIILSGCVEFPETEIQPKEEAEKSGMSEEKVTEPIEEKKEETKTEQHVEEVTQTQPIETTIKEEEVKETIYSMNENVKVDYLAYKVTKAETFTEMGTSMFDKETTGKFIKVYLDITNNAKETKVIFTPRFTIMDNQDRKYERLSDDMMYISDYLELGKQLQPGLTASGAIVFEMPKDSEDLKLIIKGDWLSISSVEIALSNIKDIGKDTTQKEKTEEIIDEAMEEAEEMVEELQNKCNTPFKCSSNCATFSDVGQKDCPSGQVCCMTEQSEVDQQMEELEEQAQQQVEDLMNQCNSPFRCTSSCPQYMDVGQKDCPAGQLCCME